MKRHSSKKCLNIYLHENDTTYLIIRSINRPDLVFTIDSEDCPRVKALHWQVLNQGERTYARSIFPIKNYPWISLHSFILSCPAQDRFTAIDHINRNTFDNRKGNLRFTSKSINNHNRRSTKKVNSYLPKGVFAAPAGRYKAVFSGGKKTRHLGTFDTPQDAEQVYISYSKSYYSI